MNSPTQWEGITNTEGMNFKFATAFVDQLTEIYFLVNDSLIYKSNDGGRTLNFVSSVPGGKLNSIYAVDHGNTKNIYACGQGIRVSTDFGLTWEDFGLNEFEVVRLIYESYSLLEATKNNGFFAKYHSQVDWLPFSGGLGDGKIINDAMNYTSWVLHTATANHSVFFLWLIINDVESDSEFNSPENFLLFQNYPNPFNPTTKIQFAIGSRQLVQLKIFDILGKEITTLINEERLAGIYEVDFDAGKYGLSSGVFFISFSQVIWLKQKRWYYLVNFFNKTEFSSVICCDYCFRLGFLVARMCPHFRL
ncbi:5'-Nucleotidase domain protein [Ignavibacterium album JCM 16511]|uniref:5'-Nucleotidase domain protein n=1 Tax=Ignavibacterium album (strain DSM 19864 / JCM 16511 / NBRC 101810 / Mat9-16) TaxID=945713 RepID=I0AIZ9_IGNAJ|nr:T9SS type A sorting domain-containing protein [Ignavibacterium album]AFH48956.1 5'-Nucleotidase domain protein [Ignavibacterium album JCM 16511]